MVDIQRETKAVAGEVRGIEEGLLTCASAEIRVGRDSIGKEIERIHTLSATESRMKLSAKLEDMR